MFLEDGNSLPEGEAVFQEALGFQAQGLLDKAVQCFTEFVSLGGHAEKAWYAKYSIARIRHDLRQSDLRDIIQAYAEAYDFRPSRLEPVAHLARIYREAGDHQTAYKLSRLVIETPRPSGGLGFEPLVYDLILPMEFVQACRALGREEECRGVVRSLLSQPGLPDEIKALLLGAREVHLPPSIVVAEGPLAFVAPGWWEIA